MSEEEQLSRRLHGLVAQPPVGRNLVPAIHKAASRRRTRYLAAGTGLGVTGVVAVGAVALSSPTTSAGTGWAGTVSPVSGRPLSADTLPHATVAPVQDAVSTVRAAPFWFQRSVTQYQGKTQERQAWIGHRSTGYLEQPFPPADKVKRLAMGIATFTAQPEQTLSWDDFSAAPTTAQLKQWLYGSPSGKTPVMDASAFEQARDLLFETPTTATFRLAVLGALKQVPGVVVTGRLRDALGREGVGLSRGNLRYIIDPSDGRLLQYEELSGGCPAGGRHVEFRDVVLAAGAVGSAEMVLPAPAVTLSDAGLLCPDGLPAAEGEASAAAQTEAVPIASSTPDSPSAPVPSPAVGPSR